MTAVATPAMMGRAAFVFYGTGATVALVLTLTHQAPHANVWLMRVVAGSALAAGVLPAAFAWQMPAWTYHVYNIVGTTAVTLLIALAHGGPVAVALAAEYVFVPLDSFFFFRWRTAIIYQAYGAVACVYAWYGLRALPLQVVIGVSGTGVVAAFTVGWLVRAAATAETDMLTGLLNRRGIDQALDAALGHASRSGEPLTIGYLDLDRFKRVNDRDGHAAGDAVLRGVADAWSVLVPSGVTLGRQGSDEFVVVLPGYDAQAAYGLLERMRTAAPAGQTCSAGYAVWERGDTASMTFSRADVALYQVKRTGRNRVGPVPGTGVTLGELRAAIAAGELAPVFQPIAALATGETVGAEALVRWRHPTRGAVLPADFIPLAEESGLVAAIDALVLDAALAETAAAERAGRYLGVISVNASGAFIDRPDVVAAVGSALPRHGLDPSRLMLEVTESSLAADSEVALAKLRQLRATSVRIAIDDFGTGYSSLARLEQLPLDMLKIDRAFVRRIAEGAPLTPIVATIVALADALGLAVVAEGIEEPFQAAALAAHGVADGQGWPLGRPGPFADLDLAAPPEALAA